MPLASAAAGGGVLDLVVSVHKNALASKHFYSANKIFAWILEIRFVKFLIRSITQKGDAGVERFLDKAAGNRIKYRLARFAVLDHSKKF